jgi:predicted HTH domain antitoxin
MAATKTSRNDTPNTGAVSESKIARMKVGELRKELANRGVKGTADLKKPDLVKKLIKAESGGRKKAASSRNDTRNTPDVSESKIASMKVSELRKELGNRGVKGTADLKKADLVKKMIKLEASGGKSASAKSTSGKSTSAKSTSGKSTSAKSTSGKAGSAKAVSAKAGSTKSGSAKSGSAKSSAKPGGKRTGKKTSDSLKYAQEITSTDDSPERAGRSLVTTDHEVIRRWAEARKAVPATVAGTEHGDHLGVLRFDFPGYSGDRLTEVSWDEWFGTFDERRLNFIYQERQADGKPSNFFRLENPDE